MDRPQVLLVEDDPDLREAISVVPAHGGEVVEWLAEDGDRGRPGQPLIRLHPTQEV